MPKQKYFAIVIVLLVIMVVLFNLLAGNLVVQEGMHSPLYGKMEQEKGPAARFLAKPGEQEQYAILCTDEDSPHVKLTTKTLEYLHVTYRLYSALHDISEETLRNLEAVIVTDDQWETLFNREELENFLNKRGAILFEELPSIPELRSNRYNELFGIVRISGREPQKSVRFYDNILLTDQIYEDINLTGYDVKLAQSCKVYAQEFPKPEDGHWPDWSETIHYNPLIWRNYWNGGQIQIMNGNFMDDLYGMGILAGILAEMPKISLTPIANVAMLSAAGFPSVQLYNSQHFQEKYFRNSEQTMQDVVWPSLLSISSQTKLPLTAFWSPGIPGTEKEGILSQRDISFWLRDFSKHQLEMGISSYGSTAEQNQEILEMLNHITEVDPNYYPTACFISRSQPELTENPLPVSGITAVAEEFPREAPQDWGFRFAGEDLVVLPASSDTDAPTARDMLIFDSIASGFGYAHIMTDLSILDGQENWNAISKEIGMLTSHTVQAYPWLNRLPVSDGGALVSRFLATDAEITRQKTGISVTSSQPGMQFIFRCEYHISDIQGGTAKEIKEDIYLVTMQETEMNIDLVGVNFK